MIMRPITYVTVLLLVGIHLISAQTSLEYKSIPPAIIYGDGAAAALNITDPFQFCPSAWRSGTINGIRVCGRPLTSNNMCHSTFYSTGGRTFSSVCGRVTRWQVGCPEAFHSSRSISTPNVEGVSITHGIPQSHIWTYAADTSETSSSIHCPCDNSSSTTPPSYVGSNYYCESGN